LRRVEAEDVVLGVAERARQEQRSSRSASDAGEQDGMAFLKWLKWEADGVPALTAVAAVQELGAGAIRARRWSQRARCQGPEQSGQMAPTPHDAPPYKSLW
jgi:hypothetical protein